MAFKSPRVDRKSQASCSTVTVVVFVALCLVGVWMMTSSSLTPVPTVNVSSESQSEVKGVQEASQTFDDSPGDLPQDAIQGDNDKPPQDDNPPKIVENIQENPIEEAPERQSSKEKVEEPNEDMRRGNTGTDSGGPTDGQDKNPEQDSVTGDKQQSQSEEQQKDQSDQNEGSKKQSKTDDGNGQGDGKLEGGQKNEKQVSPSEAKDKEKTQSESFPNPAQSELLNETNIQAGTWRTQDTESKNEKDAQKLLKDKPVNDGSGSKGGSPGYSWKLCNVTAGPDYIPCLDNEEAIRHLRTTKHYEHRERHCPQPAPTCLVPLPKGYKRSIEWPKSRDKIWYYNVPHTKLVEVKGHQNWVKVSGEHLIFPGGGTQFKNGAQHYIEFVQELEPNIAWGNRSRVILDVGCGVASFGGYLFDNDVLTMSFAPKDEHEAQVQFALERGIPAISAVMGTQRLPFPSKVFDAIHCARCRVPWHIEGGKLLLELNRVLRPGGYFIWSATPVYQHRTDPEDAEIWEAMTELTKAMCWDIKNIQYDKVNEVGAAIYQKPSSNDCYESRETNKPPMCQESDDPNAAWYVPLQSCMHKVPVDSTERGTQWPEQWPLRLEKPPYWLSPSQTGVYGKPAPDDFKVDYEHWQRVVSKSYLKGLGINWSTVRNVMDMRAVYGGFAAALKELNIWVMNVVPIDSADTLPIIYERGLFGIYHDWCQSFSTYPRTYDLLHADHLFSKVQKKCDIVAVVSEVDRILRPEGKLIVRDEVETINQIENLVKSLQWEVRLSYSKDKEGLLCVQKTMWRPQELSAM